MERANGCHGAQIVEGNTDTATGYEGQVWAQCFGTCPGFSDAVRDPTKDQSIVSLYLVCVLALLGWALIRCRLGQSLIERARTAIHARLRT